jgi:nucleoside-diphosphate-sugar epimerase
MKIVVTGGAGYIGSVLCPMLVAEGHDVTVIDRMFFETKLPPEVRVVKRDTRGLDVTNFYGVDRVIDLAGISNDPSCDLDPSITIDFNFRGGLNVAQKAHIAGVPSYVYASSCAVYGAQGAQGRSNELDQPSPLSEYARAKVAVERALERIWQAELTGLTIYRFATVYGVSPRMRFDLAPNLMALRAFGDMPIELWSPPGTLRPFVHVRDVAHALCNIHAEGLINLGSDESLLTVEALADLVATIRPTTIVRARTGPDGRSYAPDFSRLRKLCRGDHYPRITLEEGLLEIFAALDAGTIRDGIQARTVERYKYLIEQRCL